LEYFYGKIELVPKWNVLLLHFPSFLAPGKKLTFALAAKYTKLDREKREIAKFCKQLLSIKFILQTTVDRTWAWILRAVALRKTK